MRSLAWSVLAIALVLSAVAPALVWADDDDSKTAFVATVAATTTGFTAGDRVEVKWEPTVGREWEVKNKTAKTKAKGTVDAATDLLPPSNTLVGIVTSSNNPGLPVGSTINVEV